MKAVRKLFKRKKKTPKAESDSSGNASRLSAPPAANSHTKTKSKATPNTTPKTTPRAAHAHSSGNSSRQPYINSSNARPTPETAHPTSNSTTNNTTNNSYALPYPAATNNSDNSEKPSATPPRAYSYSTTPSNPQQKQRQQQTGQRARIERSGSNYSNASVNSSSSNGNAQASLNNQSQPTAAAANYRTKQSPNNPSSSNTRAPAAPTPAQTAIRSTNSDSPPVPQHATITPTGAVSTLPVHQKPTTSISPTPSTAPIVAPVTPSNSSSTQPPIANPSTPAPTVAATTTTLETNNNNNNSTAASETPSPSNTNISEPTTSNGSTQNSTHEAPQQSSTMYSRDSADQMSNTFDTGGAWLVEAYESIKEIEQTKLPRGGISMETKSVGRIQFGIPPETIKDSMTLGLPVPQVYIVPAERFCREMGPALGVNLAEFEFPAYFNFFVYKKQCTLVVDSQEAQDNICRVFSETLLGPAQFRGENAIAYEEEDFSPDFPREAIPDMQKELHHFRKLPDGSELAVEKLLEFYQFKAPIKDGAAHENLGMPPRSQIEEDYDAATDDDVNDMDPRQSKGAKWVGDLATVWPVKTTQEEKDSRSVPRLEIFKMPSGTEYIIHDIDADNKIVAKARFSGHVKVSESMSVDGFGGHSILDDVGHADEAGKKSANEGGSGGNLANTDHMSRESPINSTSLIAKAPPTFHAPSFGVTVLGNSHGFDKSGSVSGYVLWINGRGVMIDPPPYSSATLEREGIRPRTIVGIILTHCHADHDAGAFQKVLTGSPVVVITTPTIYKSFIRKYAALASLSPALLRHSHRHKPAIIGQPLRFQGATFHFTYSLHTIPCVGFRVDWRGRSMVFTGDHFNSPPAIDQLQADGVLSKARADDLRNLPLQDADLLLHEAGAPPIHTPLDVLLQLPSKVKKRMYVVHTSTLPEDCELRVAPTGTAGTIRLDQLQKKMGPESYSSSYINKSVSKSRNSRDAYSISLEDDEILPSPWSSASNEYGAINEDAADETYTTASNNQGISSSFAHMSLNNGKKNSNSQRTSFLGVGGSSVPLVSLRPASSTDAWFILNLLSAVPFLSSLSYSSTMEVLETARVDAYCKNDIVVPSSRRRDVLCVVWEGTCVERARGAPAPKERAAETLISVNEHSSDYHTGAVWHAGDWTGPISLQPEKRLSGEGDLSKTHNIVAMSSEGVKVIFIEFSNLHEILTSGSSLYRKYLERRVQQQRCLDSGVEVGSLSSVNSTATQRLLSEAMRNMNVLELLDLNSAMRKLTAVQKRHLESLAEGPIGFGPGERLWRSGSSVDQAFLMVSGTASFVPKRRNAGPSNLPSSPVGVNPPRATESSHSDVMNGDDLRREPLQTTEETVATDGQNGAMVAGDGSFIHLDSLFSRSGTSSGQGPGTGAGRSVSEAHDFVKLSRNLQKRADILSGLASDASAASSHDASQSEDSEHLRSSVDGDDSNDRRNSLVRRRSSRARFENKVLGRLYSRRAFTSGLIFSRGHFLGDVSKMVAGLLSTDGGTDGGTDPEQHKDDSSFPKYGFGDHTEGGSTMTGGSGIMENLTDMVISEQGGDRQIVHSSTLTAGKEGCVVLVFPKANLIPFLDEYPGLLLSLLGTQVVV